MKTIEKVFISLILIALLIGFGFVIKDRINRGCWDVGKNELVEEFEMNNYSCEELRDLLLIEVFPKELRRTTTILHCDGEIVEWGFGTESLFYYEYDYKEYYRNKCLVNSK